MIAKIVPKIELHVQEDRRQKHTSFISKTSSMLVKLTRSADEETELPDLALTWMSEQSNNKTHSIGKLKSPVQVRSRFILT